jgi:hypothetical protein
LLQELGAMELNLVATCDAAKFLYLIFDIILGWHGASHALYLLQKY